MDKEAFELAIKRYYFPEVDEHTGMTIYKRTKVYIKRVGHVRYPNLEEFSENRENTEIKEDLL